MFFWAQLIHSTVPRRIAPPVRSLKSKSPKSVCCWNCSDRVGNAALVFDSRPQGMLAVIIILLPSTQWPSFNSTLSSRAPAHISFTHPLGYAVMGLSQIR
ncbi:hypothetical protein RRG08_038285 [Elysia crispata]|uniref:Uncharacterized protein n=1 Tax=Elysia crispata TaxID=231223 RepID=A0AAE1AN18_9GAST|nr:hypothetical protein RRG08_038285 [Elysia crispata]